MSGKEYSSEEIARLYETHTPDQIAALTQWKLWRVYAVLHELGVEMRPQGRQTILENPGQEYLESLQGQGLSQQKIANMLNVSKRTIQRWLGK